MSARQMSIGLLMEPTGVHIASWLDPRADLRAASDIGYWMRMAQRAEQARFDFVFEADTPSIPTDHLVARSRRAFRLTKFEPLTLLSALAAVTDRIGVGGTMSTTFNEPYNVARQFASLDLLSGGRAAWNVVTTANDYAARNFGLDSMPEHDDRYDRAREFVSVVRALWDSYEDDAFVRDRDAAFYVDPDKFHVLDHRGGHFRLHGAIASERSAQGQPVIIQAGASNAGRELAAETAEVVFGSAPSLDKAQALYADLKGRMARYGRAPDELKLLPGLSMLLADSQQEAEDRYQALQERIHSDVMRQVLAEDLEIDLSSHPIEAPITPEMLPARGNLHEAYFKHLSEIVRNERPTLRELFFRWSTRGRNTFRGTPMQAADLMEEYFVGGGCDGFMVSFQVMAGNFETFTAQVVPELQRRGLFRREYAGPTLRDHLGLARPSNRHAPTAAAPPDASPSSRGAR